MNRKGRGPIPQPEFDEIVEEALASVPRRFLDLLRNVAVVVEDEPTQDDLDDAGMEGMELLGLFRGVALPDQGFEGAPVPAEVAIFRGPLGRVCETREQLIEEIRDTVVHELGHYFGLDDDEMEY